jgi:hypothetical protein
VSVEALVRAALAASGGTITHSHLVHAIAGRLGVHDMPELMEHEAFDFVPGPAARSTESEALAAVAGRALLDELTIEEQLVLPYLQDPVTVISQNSRLRRTHAWKTANRVKLKLVELLAEDHSASDTLREAINAARNRWNLP